MVVTYDALNQVRQVVDAIGGVTALTYDPNGTLHANRRTRLTLPNGVTTEYAYDAASQPTAAARGFPVILTPDDNPLHADIVVPNSTLSPQQAAALSALFQQNIRSNPGYLKR